MKVLKQDQLDKMLDDHEQWVNGPKYLFGLIRSGKRADFSGMLLKDLHFKPRQDGQPRDLTAAVFKDTILSDCNREGVRLQRKLPGAKFKAGLFLELALLSRVTVQITQKELDGMLERHATWLEKKPLFFGLGRAGKQADFRGINLAGLNLTGKDLRQAILSDGDRFAVLDEAILVDAKLAGNLQKVRLTSANLTKTDLTGADLTGANLMFAEANGAVMRGCTLHHANLMAARLRGASLVDAKCDGALMDEAILIGADLKGTSITSASAPKAHFRQSPFGNLSFETGIHSVAPEKAHRDKAINHLAARLEREPSRLPRLNRSFKSSRGPELTL